MDTMKIESILGLGTKVTMTKTIQKTEENELNEIKQTDISNV